MKQIINQQANDESLYKERRNYWLESNRPTVVRLYPGEAGYSDIPRSYNMTAKDGATLKQNQLRGLTAVGAMATSPVAATTYLGVKAAGGSNKVAEKTAIGIGLVTGTMATGVAAKSNQGKTAVIQHRTSTTNTHNYMNTGKNKTVLVTLESNGKLLFDTNQNNRLPSNANPNSKTAIYERTTAKPNLPNSNMQNAHGEIGVLQQLHNAGLAKDADVVLTVKGKDVCGYCKGDIPAMAKKIGVNSITIHANTDGPKGSPITYYWNRNTPGRNSSLKTK